MSDEDHKFDAGYNLGVSEAMGRIKQLERENKELKDKIE